MQICKTGKKGVCQYIVIHNCEGKYKTTSLNIVDMYFVCIHVSGYIPSDAKMNDAFERDFKSSSLHENPAAIYVVKETHQNVSCAVH